mgnify:CR=1 FL=1
MVHTRKETDEEVARRIVQRRMERERREVEKRQAAAQVGPGTGTGRGVAPSVEFVVFPFDYFCLSCYTLALPFTAGPQVP